MDDRRPDDEGWRLEIPELPELKDRARAFRQALREVTVAPEPAPTPRALSPGDVLNLESRYRFLESLGRPSLDEHPGMPGRRDLVFEEQWLLAGREEEHGQEVRLLAYAARAREIAARSTAYSRRKAPDA